MLLLNNKQRIWSPLVYIPQDAAEKAKEIMRIEFDGAFPREGALESNRKELLSTNKNISALSLAIYSSFAGSTIDELDSLWSGLEASEMIDSPEDFDSINAVFWLHELVSATIGNAMDFYRDQITKECGKAVADKIEKKAEESIFPK
jgi:hypothetical protein